jgi:hypothetical protein
MDMQQLLAEIEHLDAAELEQVRQQIAQREDELRTQQRPRTVEEWSALSKDFLDDFWADTEVEEKEAIVEAIREKNKPQK